MFPFLLFVRMRIRPGCGRFGSPRNGQMQVSSEKECNPFPFSFRKIVGHKRTKYFATSERDRVK